MRIELRDLQRRLGITSVYVTHDLEEALAMSDRIVVMRDGLSSRPERRRRFIVCHGMRLWPTSSAPLI